MNLMRNRTPAALGRWRSRCPWLLLGLLALTACGAGPSPAPAPVCTQACQDGVALRALRSAMKVAYNFKVAAQPVGAQDAMTPCISFDGAVGGSVHIFGKAMVNAVQGASIVSLTYDFKNCLFSAPPDPSADQNYSVTLTGQVTEQGTLSVQPTATTALLIETLKDPASMQPSDTLSIVGTVYDPPLDYSVSDCALSMIQNGNAVSGVFCGRKAGYTF